VRFTAKLGNMRKEKDWVTYPRGSKPEVIVQCDDRIAVFNPENGKGLLSKSTRNPGFIFLNPALGATLIQVPPEVIKLALTSEPKPGQEIGPGIYLAPAPPPKQEVTSA
jgi:hypothetical protein